MARQHCKASRSRSAPSAQRLMLAAGSFILTGALCLTSLTACHRTEEIQEAPITREVGPVAVTAVTDLAPGQPVTREMRGGELHAYRIALEAGEYLHLVVDQQGIDVVATLFSPESERLIAVDGLTGSRGPETILWLAEASGDYRLEARALGREAPPGRYEVGIRELRAATDQDRKRVDAARMFVEGEELRRQDHPDSLRLAISRYESALALWEDLGNLPRQGEVLHQLGRVHWPGLGEIREAREYYERALPLAKAVGNVRLQASTLHTLGRICYRRGEMERARDHYEQTLPLRRQLGDRRGEATTSSNLGIVNRMLGEPGKALNLYDPALKIWREIGNREQEALVLHNRGICYRLLGKEQQALDDLSQALAIRQDLGLLSDQALTLLGMGRIYRNHEESQERMIEFFQRALALAEEAGDRWMQAVTLTDIGSVVHETSEQQKQALECLNKALTISRSFGDRRQEALVLHNIGLHFSSLDKPRRALEYFRRALPLYEEIRYPAAEVNTLRLMASSERRLGNLVSARELIERALGWIEDLRTKPASQDLRSSYFATKQVFYDFYIDLLMELDALHPAAGHDAEALAASERAHARSLLETLIESGADLRRGADPALRVRERELERRINSKEFQRLQLIEVRSTPETPEQLATVGRELRSLLREYEKVRGQIRISSPHYAALTQPRPLSAAEIQRQVLDEETLLLEYDLGEKRSFLWAVTSDSISSFELPGQAVIERAARRAYELVSVSNRRETRVPTRIALAALSEMLLDPVADLLGDKRLLIVSEGALQYVPFGALPVPGSAERDGGVSDPRTSRASSSRAVPLIVEHEISSMPSASALAVLRRQVAGRRQAPGMVAVVADPVFQSHDPRFRERPRPAGKPPAESPSRGAAAVADLRRFERLVFSRQEADAILALVPAGKHFAALGFAANRETATSGALAGYRIVHFATHGDLNAEHPELSRLVLSLIDEEGQPRDDGFLHAHEVYDLELPAELVVLSGCQTALGKEIRGEGLVGLTQGFMYAGAARVVVTLWQVDDRATAELMARFYEHLLGRELRPAAALREAQISISREKPWRAPYYWAGFVVQGEW
ncbi:MAG: CHAT domain-containing protein [bacterium]|nr:CHAT domain-containing protein [bacterium]